MWAERTVTPFVPATIARTGDSVNPRGHAAGYAAGWAAGARAAAQVAENAERRREADHAAREEDRDRRVAAATRALEAAAQGWRDRAEPTLADAVAQLQHAALDLAGAVVGHELADGPGRARSVLARVMAATATLDRATIRVNPRDHGDIAAIVAGGEATLNGDVDWIDDDSLAPGDMVVEHPAGSIDGRIHAALARAKSALEGP